MSVQEQTETSNESAPGAATVVAGTFSVIVLLAAVAYSVMANVVNWVAVDLLTYPVQGVAPFVVISGAILTIPILIPTALVSVQFLK
ncbi:hypothetical protein D3D02_15375 [Halobellus sp. Atlit-38R]|jgi:hypothetical protein|uniref:hypothetical protein n=1 Tax=Halobellus sp. Atlit-38R TaxID=2282131 RepID=UPI000EF22D92|nr:hypothetical protein [Halobellus sp. Atlit-38R]RLM84078.1 hypothetical protein D3D02_15375 [Halobellus sp. Atlit-38R]